MSDGPYRVYDLMTGELLGRYETDTAARTVHAGEPITVIYRPGRKKKVKK